MTNDPMHAWAERVAAYILTAMDSPPPVEEVSRKYIFPERYHLAPTDQGRGRSKEVDLIIAAMAEARATAARLHCVVSVDLELSDDHDGVVSYGVEFTLVPEWRDV